MHAQGVGGNIKVTHCKYICITLNHKKRHTIKSAYELKLNFFFILLRQQTVCKGEDITELVHRTFCNLLLFIPVIPGLFYDVPGYFHIIVLLLYCYDKSKYGPKPILFWKLGVIFFMIYSQDCSFGSAVVLINIRCQNKTVL